MSPARMLLLFMAISLPFSPLIGIEISNRAGKTIEVEVLQIEPSRIQIRMTNGQTTWLERSMLSEKSQSLINDSETSEKDSYMELNALLGIDLFTDTELWDDTAETVAKRLGWPKESLTNTQSSYRKYPKEDYRILDSRPYSAVLYGNEGETSSISIVFANKGDFKFSEPPTEDEIENMEDAIEVDAKRIEQLLTRLLGEAERQQYGSGRGIKQLKKRWDWKDHAFLLASRKAEYVSLNILKRETADNKGRGNKISDARLREQNLAQIIREENGDIRIGNIPMVNQGPKGYCVPATFERYLRYLNMPADMYTLAMTGQTDIGGGTSLSRIIDSIEGYVASQNRSMKRIETEIDVRTVRKYIDKGLPIIWSMFSTKEYNEFANKRTEERKKTIDWAAWKEATKRSIRNLKLGQSYESAHACMIVGYNRETDEIAVSDSWGPKYELRWLPAAHAEQVSQSVIYLIEY
ncbi:MAG: C39 family peptidase [Verrucomicrobiota bacterium]